MRFLVVGGALGLLGSPVVAQSDLRGLETSAGGNPSASPAIAACDAVPEGLSVGDWASIRGAYEAGRYQVFAVDGGQRARNPGQQWTTRFDGRGFDTTPDAGGWTFGLELARYGWGDAESAVERPRSVTANGGRVAYAWDDQLIEWYVNDRRGLEHGYTVWARPAEAHGPLVLVLTVRGGLVPEVADSGRDVRLVDTTGVAVLDYAGLSVFDANGRMLKAGWEGFAGGLRLTVDDRGAHYPLTIDPIVQQAYLKASNTETRDDLFGSSVSVSGDTVVVGAGGEDSNATGVDGNQSDNSATDAGAAYVFVRSGTSWSQQAYLKASNTGTTDTFGWSVSVSGDTVVVGARGEDSNATGVDGNQSDNSASGAGAAYVFLHSVSSWSQQAYLKASNTGTGDEFGGSVSVSGDTVVVGARGEDSNATGVDGNQGDNSVPGAGAAYIFDLAQEGGSFATYGSGTPGKGGFVPSAVLGGSWAIDEDLTLSIRDGLGGAPALLIMGFARDSIPFAGGELLVGTPWLLVNLALGGTSGIAGAGILDLTGTIPDDAGLVGLVLDFQVLVVDAAAIKNLALSNGAELVIGG